MQWHTREQDMQLAAALAQAVAEDLRQALRQRERVLLAVSGGNTPRRFLHELSAQELDWSRVVTTLVDERWVPADHPRSNARLVREQLLHGKAADTRFVPLYLDAPTPESGLPGLRSTLRGLPWPADVVVLGMGQDGHTASFFPGGDHLLEALDPNGSAVVLPMRAPAAGEPRVTLTLPCLLGARALHLQIEGTAKREVLEAAVAGADLPIGHVLRQASQLQVWWCA